MRQNHSEADCRMGTKTVTIRERAVLGKSSLTISAQPVGARAYVSAIDSNGRTIWIADAHRDDGQHGFRRTRVPESAEPLEEGFIRCCHTLPLTPRCAPRHPGNAYRC